MSVIECRSLSRYWFLLGIKVYEKPTRSSVKAITTRMWG